jgi:hypothetical protein
LNIRLVARGASRNIDLNPRSRVPADLVVNTRIHNLYVNSDDAVRKTTAPKVSSGPMWRVVLPCAYVAVCVGGWAEVWVSACCYFLSAGRWPRGDSAAARQRALLARMHSRMHSKLYQPPTTRPCLYIWPVQHGARPALFCPRWPFLCLSAANLRGRAARGALPPRTERRRVAINNAPPGCRICPSPWRGIKTHIYRKAWPITHPPPQPLILAPA